MTAPLNLKDLQPPKIEIFWGTANVPAVVDYPRTVGQSVLASMDHVHDVDGYCLKNRFGIRCLKNRFAIRCDDPLPEDKEATLLDFVRDHLGLELLPWQEDFLKAVVSGKHLFEHKLRHVETHKMERETYGFFETAYNRVNVKIDPSEWEIVSRPAFPFRSMK